MKYTYQLYWQGKDDLGRVIFDSNTTVEWTNPGTKELAELNDALLSFAKSRNDNVVRVVTLNMWKIG